MGLNHGHFGIRWTRAGAQRTGYPHPLPCHAEDNHHGRKAGDRDGDIGIA